MGRDVLLARYARWMRSAHYSERTVGKRIRMAERLLDEWPDPARPSAADLAEWLGESAEQAQERCGRPWSSATAASYYSDVRAFFTWLHESNQIPENPTDSKLFKRPRAGQSLPKPLAAAEVQRALDHARGNVYAWLILALGAGLRAHEIAKIRGEDVTEDFVYVRGKGGKEAFLPANPEIWELAQHYPRRGWWFPSPEHDGHVSADSITIMVGRLFREVGIPTGSIHRCRHTYATRLLRESGLDLREVQKLMRHSSVATTALYTEVSEDRLRAAIKGLRLRRPEAS